MLWRWLSALVLAVTCAAPAEADKPAQLPIISGFLGPRQFRLVEEPFWLSEVPALTAGRAVGMLQVGSSLGITPEQMLAVMRHGLVSFGTLEGSALAVTEPELAVLDLPLLNDSFASLRRTIALWRPQLASRLHQEHQIDLLAVFIRPPQVMFCTKPFSGLLDLAGRRVRVASVNQSDLVLALGAVPVVLALERVVAGMQQHGLDCAVTGALPASVVGLSQVARYASTVPLGWSTAFLTANSAAWAALPATIREPLRTGIAGLERAMWQAAETQQVEGDACLADASSCPVEAIPVQRVIETAASRQAVYSLFATAVLPGWIGRCGAACAERWQAVAGATLPHSSP